MEADDLGEISTLVRSGFFKRDDVVRIMSEEYYEHGTLDEGELSNAVEEAFDQLVAEQDSWPVVTDCDKLDKAFAALNQRGVIALQNAGMDQSDGFEDFRAALDEAPNRTEIIGYCFYHGQDLARAVRSQGLFLAFGPVGPSDEEICGAEVGRLVQEEMARVGFEVEWDGSFTSRISIPNIHWQRRVARA